MGARCVGMAGVAAGAAGRCSGSAISCMVNIVKIQSVYWLILSNLGFHIEKSRPDILDHGLVIPVRCTNFAHGGVSDTDVGRCQIV